MLTKIIITLLIILGALFYLRKPTGSTKTQSASRLGNEMMFKYVIYGFILVSMLASAGYWYWHWQDGNQIVNVTIMSPLDKNSMTYEVRKKDISINEIITLDGLNIRLSSQERVIIAKNKQQ